MEISLSEQSPIRVSNRSLLFLLRCLGLIDLLAAGAVAMPFSRMQRFHEWLGLGVLPPHSMTEFLARQTSLWYAAYGLLLVRVTFRWPELQPAVFSLGLLMVAFAVVLPVTVIACGLPLWWAIGQSAVAGVHAVTLFLLSRRSRQEIPVPPLRTAGESSESGSAVRR